MTLGRTTSGSIKIKTDGGLRAVECACCGGGCNLCVTNLTPYPSLLESLENATSVAINTGSTLSSFTKTADGGFDAFFTGPGDFLGYDGQVISAYIGYNKTCKQISIGVNYNTMDSVYHYTHETCFYDTEQSGGLTGGWDQAPTSPAVVNGVSFPMLAFWSPSMTGMPSGSIVFTVS